MRLNVPSVKKHKDSRALETRSASHHNTLFSHKQVLVPKVCYTIVEYTVAVVCLNN